MKEYKLPFGYLSYTQYRTWKESRKEYWEKYVIGEKMFHKKEELPWVTMENFLKYKMLMEQKKALMERMKVLSGEILGEMEDEKVKLLEVPGGVYSITPTGKLSLKLI